MYRKSFVRRAAAAALSLTLAATLIPSVRAADPVVDESFYGTLDYYGALTEGSVVKSYRLNGNTDLADRGNYTQVNNLTDRTEPVVEGDRVTFHIGDSSLKNFYFEGKTDQPFREMPFRIAISYKMNGVACDAEDMAGQTGLAEITLDVTPNPMASAYQRNNFALEAMTLYKDSDLLSIEAPGGQLQKVGDLDAALFLVLPGEERSFTLRVGSEDFSFPGFTFLVQPATLAQLDQVAELRQAKEDLEDAAGDVGDSLDAILDSLDTLSAADGDLRRTADGLDQLNRARATLAAGKGRVYDQADRTLASLTQLTETLKPAVDHIRTGKQALTESADHLRTLTGGVDGLRPELQTLHDDLAALQGDMNALNEVLNQLKADGTQAQGQLGTLSGDLGNLSGHLETFQGDMSAIERTLNSLSRTMADVREDLEQLRIDLDFVNRRIGQLRTEVDALEGVSFRLKTIDSIPIEGKNYTPADIRAAKVQMDGTAATATTPRTPGLYDLCVALGYRDEDHLLQLEKEEALTVFILKNAQALAMAAVENDPVRKAAFDEQTAQAVAQAAPAAAAQAAAQKMAALYPDLEAGTPQYEAAYQAVYQAVLADEGFQDQVRSQVAQGAAQQVLKQSGLDQEAQARILSLLHYQWDTGINIRQQLENLDKFNGYMRQGNEKIRKFNDTLDGLTTATVNLLRAVQTTLTDLDQNAADHADSLVSDSQTLLDNAQLALNHTRTSLDDVRSGAADTQALLDTAQTLIGHLTGYDNGALNQHANSLLDTGLRVSDQLDAILDQTVQLSQTITSYEPDAQDALSDAQTQIDASVGLLGDLNAFSRSLENLLRSADPDLDQGLDTSLSGLSSTLRRTADSMSSTTTLRRAKETVTKLVEDKWDEYTGEVNNLLNADPEAEMVSLTSPDNPAPNTIQLVLRSQEIQEEEDARAAQREKDQEPLGFWGRVGRMFHDFGAIFTGD